MNKQTVSPHVHLWPDVKHSEMLAWSPALQELTYWYWYCDLAPWGR